MPITLSRLEPSTLILGSQYYPHCLGRGVGAVFTLPKSRLLLTLSRMGSVTLTLKKLLGFTLFTTFCFNRIDKFLKYLKAPNTGSYADELP